MTITHELEENIELLRKFVDLNQLDQNEKEYFFHIQSQISLNINKIEKKYEEKLSFYDKIPKYLSSKLTKILIKLQQFKEQRDENILEEALKDLSRRIAYQPWLPLHHKNYFQMEQKLNSTLFQDYKNRVRLDQDQESLDQANELNEGGFIDICDLECSELNCLKIIEEVKNYSGYKNMRELTIQNKIQLLSDMRWCDFEDPQTKIQRQHVNIQNIAEIEKVFNYKQIDLRQESFKPHNFLKGKTIQNFIQNQEDLHHDPSSILQRQQQLKELRNNYVEISDNNDEIDFKLIQEEQESIFDRVVRRYKEFDKVVRRCQEESYVFNNGRGVQNIQQNFKNEELDGGNILDNISIQDHIKESHLIQFDQYEREIQIDSLSQDKQLKQLSSSKQLALLINQLSSNKISPCMGNSNLSFDQPPNQVNELISSEHNFNIQSLDQQNNQELNENLFEQEDEQLFNYNSPNEKNENYKQNNESDILSQYIQQNLIPKNNQYLYQSKSPKLNQSYLRDKIKDIKFIENVDELYPNMNNDQSIQDQVLYITKRQKFGIIQTGDVNIEQESIQENSNNFSINQLMSFCSEQYPSRIESPKSKNIQKKQKNTFLKNNLANKANNILDALQEKSSYKKDQSLKLSDALKYSHDSNEYDLSKLLKSSPDQNQILLCHDISSISLNKNSNQLKSSSEKSEICQVLLSSNLNRKLEFTLSPESVICEQQELIYDLDNIRHSFINLNQQKQQKNNRKLSFFKCEDINLTLTNTFPILSGQQFWEQFEIRMQGKFFRGEGYDFHQYQKDYVRPSQANNPSSQISVKPPLYKENVLTQGQILENSILLKEQIFEEPQLLQQDISKYQCNYYLNLAFIGTQYESNDISQEQGGFKIKNHLSQQYLNALQNMLGINFYQLILQDYDFVQEESKSQNNENLYNLCDISFSSTKKNALEYQTQQQEKENDMDLSSKANIIKGVPLNILEGIDTFQNTNQTCQTYQEQKHSKQTDLNFGNPLPKSKNKQIQISTSNKNSSVLQEYKENSIVQQEIGVINSPKLKTPIRSKNINLSDSKLQAPSKEAQEQFIFDSNFKNDICVRQFDFDDEACEEEQTSNHSDKDQYTSNGSNKQLQTQNQLQPPPNLSFSLKYFDLTIYNKEQEELEKLIKEREASKSGYNWRDSIQDENIQENPWIDNLQQQHIGENSSKKNSQNYSLLGSLFDEDFSENDCEQPKIDINNRFQQIMEQVDAKVQERYLEFKLRGLNSKYEIPLHLQKLKNEKEKLFDQFRQESENLDEQIQNISDLTKLISYNIQNYDNQDIDTEKRNQQYRNQEIATSKGNNSKLNEVDTLKNKNNNLTQIKEFDFKITDFEQKDRKIFKKQDGLQIKSENLNNSYDDISDIFDQLKM